MGTQGSFGLIWDLDKMPSSRVIIVTDPKEGRVAVAYNTLESPEILIFSRGLRTQVARWRMPKYVESLFWSPDGKHLGVLYFNAYEPYNRQGKWTGWHPEAALAGVPNVSILDAGSRKELLSFATGGYEAKAAFSPDGNLIYIVARSRVMAGYGLGSDWARDTLRAFSSTTGKLVRTFRVRGTGVRNNFAISQDGRFIAAESSKAAHSDAYYLLRFKENLGGELDAGFVILDAGTGQIIFREKRHIFGDLPSTLPLFFSEQGDLLFAGFGQPLDHLVGYSISP